jgi:hypothetical protein
VSIVLASLPAMAPPRFWLTMALLAALAGCSQLEDLLSGAGNRGGTGGVGGTGAGGAGGMAPPSPPGSGGCAACAPFVTLQSGELQTSVAEAMTFTARVCRADACGTATLTPPLPPGSLNIASFESNGGFDDVEVNLTSFNGPLRVKADWMYWRRAQLLAGDVYLLEVRDPAGQLVSSVRKRAVSTVHGSDPRICAVTCPQVVLADLPP